LIKVLVRDDITAIVISSPKREINENLALQQTF